MTTPTGCGTGGFWAASARLSHKSVAKPAPTTTGCGMGGFWAASARLSHKSVAKPAPTTTYDLK
ncbi:MAG: hypothetical protein ACRCZS_18965 [Chroococcidiopsis sp.]